PKFHSHRLQQITAPMQGPGDRASRPFLLVFLFVLLQPFAAFDRLALRGSPGADAASFRPAIEVLIADLFGGEGYQSADPHLAFQFLPEKHQAGAWVLQQLHSLCTIVIGKESKSLRIETFQQYDPGVGHPIGGSRGKCHRIRLIDTGMDRLLPPFVELSEWVFYDIVFRKRLQLVFLAYIGYAG